ncbi:MAG: DUF2959 domain-containing protein [Syntrophus sp. (in: bacteria)]|nr:DUF2959 domain-containing protein [Syntrophus sp. (in: bacteria)]
MRIRGFLLAAAVMTIAACSGIYYRTMENVGIHKRDIMVDRVKAARDTQEETKKQFISALEQFKSVVYFKGGDLETEYNKLNATLKKSEAKAAEVRGRIKAVEDVSEALFDEWRDEIRQYSNETLRRSSQQKYDATREKFADLIKAMKRAEARLDPALVPLRDQVLFMKHNLNAKAIAGLSSEVVSVQANVDSLVAEMESAIVQADLFLKALPSE